MNDTYGLPISDITCSQPVCHIDLSGLCKLSRGLYQRRTGRGSEKLDDPHTIAYTKVHTACGANAT